MMLDTATAFDGVVRRNAADVEQAERILANPFYRNIAGALSGTQEYMAAETLHLLHDDERFDLVVVDTPPSRNALDFLEAPGVLARFLDHRLFRLLMLPARRGMRVVNVATQPMLRAIGKVVGSDVLADAVAFFQAFAGMETGFRERAEAVIGAAAVGRDTLRGRRLAAPRHGHRGRLVRRQARRARHRRRRRRRQPRAPGVRAGHRRRGRQPRPPRPRPRAATISPRCGRNLAELRALAGAAAAELAPLAELLGPLAEVPLLAGDVHDLDGLGEIRRHLFSADRLTSGDRLGSRTCTCCWRPMRRGSSTRSRPPSVGRTPRSSCAPKAVTSPASSRRREPFDIAMLDLQIGSMGGMAVTMSLRLDESSGRLPHVPVLMLLDRVADVHLAKRSGADGWLVKPLDPLRLRRAVRAVTAGEPYREGLVVASPPVAHPESADVVPAPSR